MNYNNNFTNKSQINYNLKKLFFIKLREIDRNYAKNNNG